VFIYVYKKLWNLPSVTIDTNLARHVTLSHFHRDATVLLLLLLQLLVALLSYGL